MFLLRRDRTRPTVHEAAGRAPGAARPPLSRPAAGAAPPGVAEGRPAVVIRRGGRRSRRPTEPLTGRGAGDVKGGLRARSASGHPVADARGHHGPTA
ncbi:rhodanese-like domain-containing protein [Streptomyces sp. NPDC051133]|uniref:rhodanese-like domain-containing protein n=1 Tax=Streptomyces sp. NPDC051133 TaxID=3155521 RepID=UPI003439E14E